MHPGEQHIRDATIEAIKDALPGLLPVATTYFTLQIIDCTVPLQGVCVAVLDASHTEIARYQVAVTATKIGVPKVEEPQWSDWIEGVWAQVKPGYLAMGTDGNGYEVSALEPVSPRHSTLLNVSVTSGDQTFTFTPDIGQPVKYRQRLESV